MSAQAAAAVQVSTCMRSITCVPGPGQHWQEHYVCCISIELQQAALRIASKAVAFQWKLLRLLILGYVNWYVSISRAFASPDGLQVSHTTLRAAAGDLHLPHSAGQGLLLCNLGPLRYIMDCILLLQVHLPTPSSRQLFRCCLWLFVA